MSDALTLEQEERVRKIVSNILAEEEAKGKGIQIDESSLRCMVEKVFRLVGETEPEKQDLINAEELIREYTQRQIKTHLKQGY